LGFKEWAVKQLGIAKGYELSRNNANEVAGSVAEPPRKEENSKDNGPLGESLEIPSTTFAKQTLD
jgi:ATP-dependent RNA helicase DHX37/DHR1